MKFNRHLPVLIWQIKFRKKALLASISLEILLIMPPKHGSTKRPSTNNEDSIVSQKRFIVNDVDGQHAINVNQEPYEKSNNDAINESASPANAKLRANLVQQGEHGKESKDASNSKVLVARNAAPQSFTSCHSAKHGTKVHCSSIDIFTRLPYDVALLIIDLLQQHAVAECTRVCSAWRALVLDYSKPWCHIEATSWGRTRALPPYKLLPSVSQHVQEIRLLFSNQALNCIKLLRTENFHNLRVLHIQERKQSLYSELCSALPNVANTLTMLDLYIGRDDDVPYLAPILSICRNLTRLKFDSSHKDNSKAFSTMFSLSHTTRLTEIELLSRDSESIQAERLESLIQHSPHIQWVLLYNFTTDVYETVRLHCPGIKYLMVNNIQCVEYGHYDNRFSQDTSPGLKLLSINIDSTQSGSAEEPLLKKYHSTLRALDLQDCSIYFDNDRLSGPLPTYLFTNLVTFHLGDAQESICHQLGPMLKNTPNLEKLHLSSPYCIPIGVFQALTNVKKLSSLHIWECEDIDTHGLLLYFRALVHAKGLPALVDLVFEQCEGVHNSVLLTAAEIKSLQSLYLGFDRSVSRPSKITVKEFMQKAAQLPHLERLGLTRWEHITVESLRLLGDSKSLTKVEIFSPEGITDIKAFGAFPPKIKIGYGPF